MVAEGVGEEEDEGKDEEKESIWKLVK